MFHIGMAQQHPPLPDESQLSPLGIDFLRQCLTIDPTTRPTALELRMHPWIRALVDELNAEGELDAVEPGAPEAAEELAEAYVEAEAAKAISPPMGPNDSQSPEQPRHSSHNASPHDAAQDRDASTSPSSRIVPGHPDHRHPGYEALIADKQYRREEEETKAMLEPDSPYPTV